MHINVRKKRPPPGSPLKKTKTKKKQMDALLLRPGEG